MQTRAKKVAGGYKLTGSRPGSANAPIADLFLVWAKNEEGKIRGFLVEKGAKAFRRPRFHGKLGCAPRSPAKS